VPKLIFRYKQSNKSKFSNQKHSHPVAVTNPRVNKFNISGPEQPRKTTTCSDLENGSKIEK